MSETTIGRQERERAATLAEVVEGAIAAIRIAFAPWTLEAAFIDREIRAVSVVHAAWPQRRDVMLQLGGEWAERARRMDELIDTDPTAFVAAWRAVGADVREIIARREATGQEQP